MSDNPASGKRREGAEFAEASLWISRITSTIAPGLLGLWVDSKLGTRYWGLVGLVLGVTSGVLHLSQAAKDAFKKPVKRNTEEPPPERRGES